MTVKELAQVMGTQKIAVKRTGSPNVSFSGCADAFQGCYLEGCQVTRVIAANSEGAFTIIYAEPFSGGAK